MFGTIISWICIIVGLLYLQYKSQQEIKELKIKYISQEEEIKKLKEEVYSISFAYHASYPINSKKLVLNSPTTDIKYYYKLEKLRLSFDDLSYYNRHGYPIDFSLLSHLKNNHVKILMFVDPRADMLKVVKQFPNLEELILLAINVNDPDLSHLIYPSKIKKIVLVKKNNIDISPVVSYYRQQNKEVIIDEISSYGDILTEYDFY